MKLRTISLEIFDHNVDFSSNFDEIVDSRALSDRLVRKPKLYVERR